MALNGKRETVLSNRTSARHRRNGGDTAGSPQRGDSHAGLVRSMVVLMAAALLPAACRRRSTTSQGTGYSHVEALGLQRVEVHTRWASGVLTVSSSADFSVSVDAMYAACRADLESDRILDRTERSSGNGDERIEDTNGSSEQVQRACRVRGTRGRPGGHIELMVARRADAPVPTIAGTTCGPRRCSSSEYCFHVEGQGTVNPAQPLAGRVDSYECRALPPRCVSAPTCTCLGQASCSLVDGRPYVEAQPP